MMRYILCELSDNHNNLICNWKSYMLTNILLHESIHKNDSTYVAYCKEIIQMIEVCYYTLYNVHISIYKKITLIIIIYV